MQKAQANLMRAFVFSFLNYIQENGTLWKDCDKRISVECACINYTNRRTDFGSIP